MSERREMERRHTLQQIRKIEVAQRDSRATAERHRRQIRRYQQKKHLYEWHLALAEESTNSRESMERAVVQLGMFIDQEHRQLAIAESLERHEAGIIKALRTEMARLDRWKRWAALLEDWFWPVTIIRACLSR